MGFPCLQVAIAQACCLQPVAPAARPSSYHNVWGELSVSVEAESVEALLLVTQCRWPKAGDRGQVTQGR